MAPIRPSAAPIAGPASGHGDEASDLLRPRFGDLVRQWKADWGPSSTVKVMTQHPAYLQIIALGGAAVPLLLEELAREPHHWFAALRAITGANPVPPESRGDIERMAESWIAWGRANGHRG